MKATPKIVIIVFFVYWGVALMFSFPYSPLIKVRRSSLALSKLFPESYQMVTFDLNTIKYSIKYSFYSKKNEEISVDLGDFLQKNIDKNIIASKRYISAYNLLLGRVLYIDLEWLSSYNENHQIFKDTLVSNAVFKEKYASYIQTVKNFSSIIAKEEGLSDKYLYVKVVVEREPIIPFQKRKDTAKAYYKLGKYTMLHTPLFLVNEKTTSLSNIQ